MTDPDEVTIPQSAGGPACCAAPRQDRDCAAPPSLSRSARLARVVAGSGFLALAGAMARRRLPGGVVLWPASLVPSWFGISHLLAAMTGYPGCPELGAIPSLLLDRPVATSCGPWERLDAALARRGPEKRAA